MTTVNIPTYTHIVHKPDAQVQHNFSASGWEYKRRHAGTYTGKYHYGAREYATVCGKSIYMDPEHDGRPRPTVGIEADDRWITCAGCRRKLGLAKLATRRRRSS